MALCTQTQSKLLAQKGKGVRLETATPWRAALSQTARKVASNPWARPMARGALIVVAVAALSWFGARSARSSDGPNERADVEMQTQIAQIVASEAGLDVPRPPGNALAAHPSTNAVGNTRANTADTTAENTAKQRESSKEGAIAVGENPQRPGADGPGVLSDGRVVLNAATAEQLCRLPSIGPSRAAKIVQLREKLGGFKTVRQLLRIRGIGPRTLKKIEPLVVVDPPKDDLVH